MINNAEGVEKLDRLVMFERFAKLCCFYREFSLLTERKDSVVCILIESKTTLK